MNIDSKLRREIERSAMTFDTIAFHAGTTRQTISNFVKGTSISSKAFAKLCKVFNIAPNKIIEKMPVKLENWLKSVFLDTDPRYYFVLFEDESVYIKPMDRILEREFIEINILDQCKLKSLKCDVNSIDDNSYFMVIESSDMYDQLKLPFHNINHFNK